MTLDVNEAISQVSEQQIAYEHQAHTALAKILGNAVDGRIDFSGFNRLERTIKGWMSDRTEAKAWSDLLDACDQVLYALEELKDRGKR